MEYHCNAFGWMHPYQQEGLEELRQCLAYSAELEAEVIAGKEEIAKKDIDIMNLKDTLARTLREKNEAQVQCRKLTMEREYLKRQLQKEKEPSPLSSEDESKAAEEVDELARMAGEMRLPERGRLLQAVKEAGPLLRTLLLAGALPQWQHPPPPVDCFEIPPVRISCSRSSSSSLKRSVEYSDVSDHVALSTPTSKYQKLALH